jgi:hypothetical protein
MANLTAQQLKVIRQQALSIALDTGVGADDARAWRNRAEVAHSRLSILMGQGWTNRNQALAEKAQSQIDGLQTLIQRSAEFWGVNA